MIQMTDQTLGELSKCWICSEKSQSLGTDVSLDSLNMFLSRKNGLARGRRRPMAQQRTQCEQAALLQDLDHNIMQFSERGIIVCLLYTVLFDCLYHGTESVESVRTERTSCVWSVEWSIVLFSSVSCGSRAAKVSVNYSLNNGQVISHIFLNIPCVRRSLNSSLANSGEGIKSYYQGKIDELSLIIREKSQNLQRLTAQRNELNGRVRLLREELHHLQEPGSYVGEVVKAMGKTKVLVKVNPEVIFVELPNFLCPCSTLCFCRVSMWWILIRTSISTNVFPTRGSHCETIRMRCTSFCPPKLTLW